MLNLHRKSRQPYLAELRSVEPQSVDDNPMEDVQFYASQVCFAEILTMPQAMIASYGEKQFLCFSLLVAE
jgi:hypothetical protein